MTPDPRALAVLLDAARACYGDDAEQVRWLLHPEAVRELLLAQPIPLMDDGECLSCANQEDEAHDGDCRIVAAWRALGDPRGAADIERAHEEALAEERDRSVREANRGGLWDLSPEQGFTYAAPMRIMAADLESPPRDEGFLDVPWDKR